MFQFKFRPYILTLFVYMASCSPVKFSSDSKKDDDGGGGVTPSSKINCTMSLDSGLVYKNVMAVGENPVVNATCTPSDVTYNWRVTKYIPPNTTTKNPVTINGLTGSSSTGDFYTQGVGVYEISLNAQKNSYTEFNSTTPLVVAVQSTQPPTSSIACNVHFSGGANQVILNQGDSNPTTNAICTPANVSYVWTVTRNGNTVTIPNLSGSQSTPDFSSQIPGTYLVNFQALATGYNSYTLTTPLQVIVNQRASRKVTFSKTVGGSDNQLDILLVIDDSNSMLADNQRLAARLQGFVNELSTAGLDWQMCLTLTRAQQLTASDPTLYWGASRHWVGNAITPKYILKPSSGNIHQIFNDTINSIGAGWAGTDDERAIKGAYWHLWNGDPNSSTSSGCYRQNAALSVIILSDEDERSIGGDRTQQYYSTEYKAMESDDLPLSYRNAVLTLFGYTKRFTVNSIIVRPGDTTCMAQQDREGAKSHYGVHYNQLSQLTGGYVGSICDTDYSSNLKYFRERIVLGMASINLECSPLGNVTTQVNPVMSYSTRVDGTVLYFNPLIPSGRTVTGEYYCPLQ